MSAALTKLAADMRRFADALQKLAEVQNAQVKAKPA